MTPEEITLGAQAPVSTPDAKMWYLSLELWTSLVAIAAFTLQGAGIIETGIPTEIQASLVAVWMFLLRGFKTHSPIAWTKAQLAKMTA